MESEGKILKFDDEQRLVYGWASVVKVNGEEITDLQGDIIRDETLEKAATNFMLGQRNGLTMHKGEPTSIIIHSMPLTKSIKDALGIVCEKDGWLIAAKVYDDETWAKVKNGTFKGFSIGGRAVRTPTN